MHRGGVGILCLFIHYSAYTAPFCSPEARVAMQKDQVESRINSYHGVLDIDRDRRISQEGTHLTITDQKGSGGELVKFTTSMEEGTFNISATYKAKNSPDPRYKTFFASDVLVDHWNVYKKLGIDTFPRRVVVELVDHSETKKMLHRHLVRRGKADRIPGGAFFRLEEVGHEMWPILLAEGTGSPNVKSTLNFILQGEHFGIPRFQDVRLFIKYANLDLDEELAEHFVFDLIFDFGSP